MTDALLGAFAAFGAARHLGFDVVRRSTNPVLKYIAAPRSQFSLMLIVFGSRLIPFISFDAVSRDDDGDVILGADADGHNDLLSRITAFLASHDQ